MFTPSPRFTFGEMFRFAIPDAATVAQKWAQRAGAATQDYIDGAQRTEKDPTALAIANKARLVQNFTQSVNDGTWESRLRAVGKAGWQEAIRTKGAQNFANGVAQSVDKVQAAFAPLLAFEANLQRTVQAMPSNTDAERELRMLTWVRNMRGYRAPA